MIIFIRTLALILIAPLFMSCSGDQGKSGLVDIESIPTLVLETPKFVPDANGLLVKIEPNMFDVTFRFTNNAPDKVVIASINFILTYFTESGSRKIDEIPYEHFATLINPYPAIIAAGGAPVPMSQITISGINTSAVGPTYSVEVEMKGFFSLVDGVGGVPIPSEKFKKSLFFTVD